MFGLSKKKDSVIPNKVLPNESSEHALDPPKALPELAKDMFDTVEVQKVQPEPAFEASSMPAARIPSEPSSSQVPVLDLSLLKQKVASENIGYAPGRMQQPQETSIAPKIQQPVLAMPSTPREYPLSQEHIARTYVNYAAENRGELFFDRISRLLSENKIEEADKLLKALDLHKYHSKGIEGLRNLEITWLELQKREEALRMIVSGIDQELFQESSQLRISLGLGNPDFSIGPFRDGVSMNGSASNTSSIISDESRFFYCEDGKILRSLQDLALALESMDDQVFASHVNDYKNDFADWIEGVLQDKLLAQKIRPIKNRHELVFFLKKG